MREQSWESACTILNVQNTSIYKHAFARNNEATEGSIHLVNYVQTWTKRSIDSEWTVFSRALAAKLYANGCNTHTHRTLFVIVRQYTARTTMLRRLFSLYTSVNDLKTCPRMLVVFMLCAVFQCANVRFSWWAPLLSVFAFHWHMCNRNVPSTHCSQSACSSISTNSWLYKIKTAFLNQHNWTMGSHRNSTASPPIGDVRAETRVIHAWTVPHQSALFYSICYDHWLYFDRLTLCFLLHTWDSVDILCQWYWFRNVKRKQVITVTEK